MLVKGTSAIWGEDGRLRQDVRRLHLACGHHIDYPIIISWAGTGTQPGDIECPVCGQPSGVNNERET